ARGEELHRSDDVVLLHRRTPGPSWGGHHPEMHHGLRVAGGDRGHDGPDVAGDHLDAITKDRLKFLVRRHGVDTNDPTDLGMFGEAGGQPRPEVAADPGHQDVHLRLRGVATMRSDNRSGPGCPAPVITCRDDGAGFGSYAAACGASSWPCACGAS